MFSKSLQHKFARSLFFGTLVSLLFIGCQSSERQVSKTGQTFQREVQVVKPSLIPLYRSAPGQILSKHQNQISSRMMGYLTQMNVSEGDYVHKGQVLATIDPVDVQGQLEIAEASKEQALAALADAKTDFERFDRLLQEKAITQAQWEKMKLNYEVAQQRTQQANSGLKIAHSQTKYTSITSPINGVVSRKMLNMGDLVSPGYPLLTIESPNQLEIVTQVPEALYEKIKTDRKVCHYLEGKQLCDLSIQNQVPVADPLSHTHLIKLEVGELSQNTLHPGGFIEVYFPIGNEEILMIDSTSILKRAGLKGTFVLNKNREAQFRMIRTEATQGTQGKIRVQAGLKAGDQVLLGDLRPIQNFDQIEILNATEVGHE